MLIDIQGLGGVNFPDTMSPEDVQAAISAPDFLDKLSADGETSPPSSTMPDTQITDDENLGFLASVHRSGGAAVDQLGGIGAGALSWIGDVVGREDLQKWAAQKVKEYQTQTAEHFGKEGAPTIEGILTDKDKLSAFVEWAGHAMGSGAVTAIPVLLASLVGVASAPIIGGASTVVGGAALWTTLSGMAIGDIYQTQLEENEDPNAFTTLAFAAPYVASERLLGAGTSLGATIREAMIKKFGEEAVKRGAKTLTEGGAKEFFKAFGKITAGEMVAEGAQETLTQTAGQVESDRPLSDLWLSSDFWKQTGEAAAAGFVGGVPFGVVGGTIHGVRPDNTIKIGDTDVNFEDIFVVPDEEYTGKSVKINDAAGAYLGKFNWLGDEHIVYIPVGTQRPVAIKKNFKEVEFITDADGNAVDVKESEVYPRKVEIQKPKATDEDKLRITTELTELGNGQRETISDEFANVWERLYGLSKQQARTQAEQFAETYVPREQWKQPKKSFLDPVKKYGADWRQRLAKMETAERYMRDHYNAQEFAAAEIEANLKGNTQEIQERRATGQKRLDNINKAREEYNTLRRSFKLSSLNKWDKALYNSSKTLLNKVYSQRDVKQGLEDSKAARTFYGTTESQIVRPSQVTTEMIMEADKEASAIYQPLKENESLSIPNPLRIVTDDGYTIRVAPTENGVDLYDVSIKHPGAKQAEQIITAVKPRDLKDTINQTLEDNYNNPYGIFMGAAARLTDVRNKIINDFKFSFVDFDHSSGQITVADAEQIYARLVELATELNIPLDALSLNNTLGVEITYTFDGNIEAQYDPNGIIRLNPKNAHIEHEWAHAFDHHFGKRISYDVDSVLYATSAFDEIITGTANVTSSDLAARIRPEVYNAWEAIMKMITASPKYMEASKNKTNEQLAKIDAKLAEIPADVLHARQREAIYMQRNHTETYFTHPVELFARALEAVMAKKQKRNTPYNGMPYPEGKELIELEKVFDNLFKTLRKKYTKKDLGAFGSMRTTTLYEKQHPQLTPTETLQTNVDELIKEFRNQLKIANLEDVTIDFLNNISNDAKATGGWRFFDKVIEIGINSRSYKATFNHEFIHALRALGAFTNKEWAILERKAKAWRKRFDIDKAYKHLEGFDSRLDEEAIAVAHAGYKIGTLERNTPAGKILDKISKIIEAIGNALAGLGFNTYEDVFKKIEGGEVRANRFAPRVHISNDEVFAPMYNEMASLNREADASDGVKLKNDMTLLGRYLSSMRHAAHSHAGFAKVFQKFTEMRAKRMTISDQAARALRSYGSLVRDPAAFERFKKAEEINMLHPTRRVPDENGNIIFVNGPEGGRGAGSTLKPLEVVVLSGDLARVWQEKRDALNIILESMKNAYLYGSSDILRRVFGKVQPGFQLTEEALAQLTHQQLTQVAEDLRVLQNSEDELITMLGEEAVQTTVKPDKIPTDARAYTALVQKLGRKVYETDIAKKTFYDELASDIVAIKEIAQELKNYDKLTYMDYTPAARFGDYYVAVYDAETMTENGEIKEGSRPLYYEKMELRGTKQAKERAASKVVKRIREKYPDAYITQPKRATYDELKRISGGINLDLIFGLLSTNDKKLYARVKADLDQAIRSKGFAARLMQRELIPGYSMEFERGVAEYVATGAGYAARLQYAGEIENAVNKVLRSGGNLAKYTAAAHEYVMSPDEEWRTWRTLGFVYFLGGNLSSGILQTASVIQFSGPYLLQFTGIKGAPKVAFELGRAFKDVMLMHDFAKKERPYQDVAMNPLKDIGLRRDEQNVIIKSFEEGIVKQHSVLEEMGLSVSGNAIGLNAEATRSWRKFMQVWLAGPFSTFETLSRATVLLATYRLARDNPNVLKNANEVFSKSYLWKEQLGANAATPYELAKITIDDTFGLYGKINRSPYMRGAGTVVFQFQTYIHQMFELLSRMLLSQGKNGKKALAALLIVLMLTAGMRGLPGVDDAEQMYAQAYKQYTGIDLDVSRMLHDASLAYETGPFWAEMLENGLFNSLGVDIQRRISMGNMPGSDFIMGFYSAMLGSKNQVSDILGIPGSIAISNVGDAVRLANEGRIGSALSRMMPTFMRNMLEATMVYPTQGARSFAGETLVKPEDFTAGELWGKFGGFAPGVVTKARKRMYTLKRMDQAAQLKSRRYARDVEELFYKQIKAIQSNQQQELKNINTELNDLIREIITYNINAEPENKVRFDLTNISKRVSMRLHPELGYTRSRTDLQAKAKELWPTYER